VKVYHVKRKSPFPAHGERTRGIPGTGGPPVENQPQEKELDPPPQPPEPEVGKLSPQQEEEEAKVEKTFSIVLFPQLGQDPTSFCPPLPAA
jgi:hypothetical protein